MVSGIGEKGLPAEEVAEGVAREAEDYLRSEVPVGPHLADQLLLPLAIGGGTFRTSTLTAHAHTNAAVIERVLGPRFSIDEDNRGWLVSAATPAN